ncbi:uncharacterized protein LOC143289204 [Babylonia areolata]|uniref:uncharacterized protein LOC143289204 n=1 Tax=Babylonia areolata TaxID=304850 RepID=UPI003FD0AF13
MASARLQLKRLFPLVVAVYGLTLLLAGTSLHRDPGSFVHQTDTFPHPPDHLSAGHIWIWRTSNITPDRSSLTLAPKVITSNRSSIISAPKVINPNRSKMNSAPKVITSNRSSMNSAPKVINPNQSSINSDPKIINPNRSSINSDPKVINPNQSSINSDPKIINPNRSSLNSAPKVINPNQSSIKSAQKVINPNRSSINSASNVITSNRLSINSDPKATRSNRSSVNSSPKVIRSNRFIGFNRSYIDSAPKISPAVTKTKKLSTFCPMRLTAKDHVTPEEYFRPRPDPVTEVVSTFLIQPSSQFCGSFLDILFLVPSSPFGEKDRSAIRDTWGSGRWPHQPHGIHMAVLFLLARPHIRSHVSVLVEKEAATHDDVLMLDADDGYRQMTVKMLAGLQWLSQHCRLVRYVARVDADHFLNVPLFYHRVHSWFQRSPQRHRVIMGKILCSITSIVHRLPLSKHFVSFADYPFEFFPSYMAGGTYVMTAELVPRLVNVSRYVKSFTVDDAYITGVLARTLNLLLVNLPECVMRESARFFVRNCGLSKHRSRPSTMRSIWDMLHVLSVRCTQVPDLPVLPCSLSCSTQLNPRL